VYNEADLQQLVAGMTTNVLPPTYDGRSALDRWLQRFAVCATANGWDAELQGQKLPAFLDGEALVVYLEQPADRRTFKEVKAALTNAFLPPEGRGEHLLNFEQRSLHDGESPRSYLFELKRLLDLAMPNMDATAREQLLFHQFVNGMPVDISMAIRSSPGCSSAEAALARSMALMNAKKLRPGAVAAVVDGAADAATSHATDLAERMDQLERELACLRTAASAESAGGNAVAVVAPRPPRKRPGYGRYKFAQTFGGREAPKGPRCFSCLGFGHLARQCANNVLVTEDGRQQGRPQQQGNGRGAAAVRGTAGRF